MAISAARLKLLKERYEDLLAEINRLSERNKTLVDALNAARIFIEREFSDPEAQAEGEFLIREARPVHKTIVDALCSEYPT